MRTRRFILIPVFVLLAVLFVAAAIDAGKHERMVASGSTATWRPTDDSALVERLRLDRIEQLAASCLGPVECAPTSAAARFELAAEQALATGAADPRFEAVRQAVAAMLRERAELAQIYVQADADGARTHAERSRIKDQRNIVRRAAQDAIDKRHGAGLVDDLGREQLRSNLRAR
ncbi:MAG: hypothetical protein ABI200_01045 [Gaiellales bacterium]